MPKTLMDMAEEVSAEQVAAAYGPSGSNEEFEQNAKKFVRTEKLLRELMRTENRANATPAIDLSEAVHTADFKILFPKVVQDVLQRPKEPAYLGQSLLAKTIQVDGARIMEFPTLGAIRAFELSDTQEPPEQDPMFSRNITEIRVRRFGLKLEMTNDVIEESQWDVLALYTEAAGAAMSRLKEELIFREYETNAVTLFDNSSAVAANRTTGVGSDGSTANGTFDHMNLLDMLAAMGANGYNPTDIILHPLAWSVWLKDPFLRYQILHQSGVGQTLPSYPAAPEGMTNPSAIQTYMPFGLNVVVSPFQTISYNNTSTDGIMSSGAHYTTITVVDRGQSVLVLQRTPMGMVGFENPVRDIRTLMFHEKYGLAILNGGRGAVTAKNIRLDLNYAPVYTIREVAAA